MRPFRRRRQQDQECPQVVNKNDWEGLCVCRGAPVFLLDVERQCVCVPLKNCLCTESSNSLIRLDDVRLYQKL